MSDSHRSLLPRILVTLTIKVKIIIRRRWEEGRSVRAGPLLSLSAPHLLAQDSVGPGLQPARFAVHQNHSRVQAIQRSGIPPHVVP